jgi:hypothetical protein
MSDAELQRRANLYALAAVDDDVVMAGSDTCVTAIARAFVIGYAAGLEDASGDLRRTVKRHR